MLSRLIESEPYLLTKGAASLKFGNTGDFNLAPRAIAQLRLP